MSRGDHKHGVIRKILNESGFPAKIVDFMVSEIRFASGEIMATPGARHSFKTSGENPTFYLWRHLSGDCGIADPCELNEKYLSELRGPVVSCYRLRNGDLVWCITDAARLTTAFVMPDELGSI